MLIHDRIQSKLVRNDISRLVFMHLIHSLDLQVVVKPVQLEELFVPMEPVKLEEPAAPVWPVELEEPVALRP